MNSSIFAGCIPQCLPKCSPGYMWKLPNGYAGMLMPATLMPATLMHLVQATCDSYPIVMLAGSCQPRSCCIVQATCESYPIVMLACSYASHAHASHSHAPDSHQALSCGPADKLATARMQIAAREIVLWTTPSEPPKALQASECSELLDPMRASCLILAQHQPGKFGFQ